MQLLWIFGADRGKKRGERKHTRAVIAENALKRALDLKAVQKKHTEENCPNGDVPQEEAF